MLSRILFSLFLFCFSCTEAATQYVSIVATSEASSWVVHGIWVGDLDNKPHDFEEIYVENIASAKDLQEWINSKMTNVEDSIAIIYDLNSCPQAFLDSLTNLKLSSKEVLFQDVRPFIRNTLGLWRHYDTKSRLDPCLRYLVHSLPKWQSIRGADKRNFDILSNLNFEQLRAFFWGKNLFCSPPEEDKILYQIDDFYKGDRVYVNPGALIASDQGVVGSWVGNDGELVIDIIQEGNSFTLITAWTVELYHTVRNGDWFVRWCYDDLGSLLRSKDEFLMEIEKNYNH